jgi:DNA polymerase sigma
MQGMKRTVASPDLLDHHEILVLKKVAVESRLELLTKCVYLVEQPILIKHDFQCTYVFLQKLRQLLLSKWRRP